MNTARYVRFLLFACLLAAVIVGFGLYLPKIQTGEKRCKEPSFDVEVLYLKQVLRLRELGIPSKQRSLLFIHQPKTGGTSLIKMLEELGMKRNLQVRRGVEVVYLADGQNETDILAVHAPFKLKCLVSYIHEEFSVMTLLREPVHRLVSYYNFCERCKKRPFLEWAVYNAPLNSQVGYLAGRYYAIDFPECFGDDQKMTREDLDIAKERLISQVDFFGVTERYEESIWLLSVTYRWPELLNMDMNQGRNFTEASTQATVSIDQLSSEEIEQIKIANALDYELWHFAYEHFSRRLEAVQKKFPVNFRG